MTNHYDKYSLLLCKLEGIMNVKFVDDAEGNLIELHVLANRSVHPKQLARNIQSALLSKFDFAVDHKIISIAQIETDLVQTPQRLQLQALTLRYVDEDAVQISVELSKNGKTFTGHETMCSNDGEIMKAIGTATLSAIHDYTQKSYFRLVKIHTDLLYEHHILVSVVAFREKNREEMLLGTCFIHADANVAVIKSVLDAINRKLALLEQNQ
mgnify:CR=1 FL=1